MKLKLYHYWRSSSSWRVRMALTHKQISCDFVHINLLKNEQNSVEHIVRNPSGLVPCLEIALGSGKTQFISESVAIIEWLEETCGQQNPLLPTDFTQRAIVRQLVQIINADTQPIQNLRVLNKYSNEQEKKNEWARHWIDLGFAAYEKVAQKYAGQFSFGDQITMADLYLIPQVYNAKRFNVNMSAYPLVNRVFDNCSKTTSYQNSAPELFQPEDTKSKGQT